MEQKNIQFNKDDIDLSVRPQDDFYEFANGMWLKNAVIPPSEARWGAFQKLRDESMAALRDIFEELVQQSHPVESELGKLRNFYMTGMDETMLNTARADRIAPYLKAIREMQNKDELPSLLARFHMMHVWAFFRPSIELDEKDSSRYVLHLRQAGLGLPERDYYFRTDEKSKKLRDSYLAHIQNMFTLLGIQNAHTDTIVRIETILAKASMTAVELRDVESQYNVYDLAALFELSPKITWNAYLAEIGAGVPETIIVCQPAFFKELTGVLEALPLDDIKTYCVWHVIRSYAFALSDDFVTEHFNFYGKTLTGAEELKPRWKRCVAVIDGAMGEAIGKEYVARHFPPEAKAKINTLVDNLIISYRERILELDWMSEETKKRALTKLEKIERKLGYPDVWKDYSALTIGTNSYLENIIQARIFESRHEVSKLGKPVDRSEWFMTPPTVNAYYAPDLNEIVFPAAIMQLPFFSPKAEDALNYAGIGMVIGHELTHGFDDKGSLFDEHGNLSNWWTEEDRKRFKEKTDVLVGQYGSQMLFGDLPINGELTLGENIADLGGLAIAYDAFMRTKPEQEEGAEYSPIQRFFVSFAQIWQEVAKEDFWRLRVQTDPHAPDKFRVNMPLSNNNAFADAFHCKEGDAMYRKPEERVRIW